MAVWRYWALQDIEQILTNTGYRIIVTTDISCHLFMRWTVIEPAKHIEPLYRRGIALPLKPRFCFDVYEDNEQEEAGDTIYHTFIKEPWAHCETRYFYFWGTIQGEHSPSESPIFSKHRYYLPAAELTITGDPADGHIQSEPESIYQDARNAASGALIDTTSTTTTVGQFYADLSSWKYGIWRSFLYFNTSPLAGKNILTAILRLRNQTKYTGTHAFSIIVQNGMPTYPHKPLTLSDYNRSHYSGEGGEILQTEFEAGGLMDIILTPTGRSWINKTGWTKFCLRSSHDIDGAAPLGYEYHRWYSANSPGTPLIEKPRLIVTYK